MIPPSLLRRALPYLIGILIVGMIVALVATGMRVISPQTLFFPFVLLLAATALYPRQRQEDAHRGGRRRTGRLPTLPIGGAGQHSGPGRRAAGQRVVVSS
ncbi:hypothetical protein MRGA327_01825 [Mycobacterium tuberculosis RGTB327]|nr:hypothetical protein MRGA327_01825 [Mycobacterium tuberculosis RGTB327]